MRIITDNSHAVYCLSDFPIFLQVRERSAQLLNEEDLIIIFFLQMFKHVFSDIGELTYGEK